MAVGVIGRVALGVGVAVMVTVGVNADRTDDADVKEFVAAGVGVGPVVNNEKLSKRASKPGVFVLVARPMYPGPYWLSKSCASWTPFA